ncbi:unnamed protein product [Didymodactylos carnosus]|uniref:Thymidylate synthase n=1 Tax=Didymodactylos carnosus TaxID=1234261 RepID=A0A815ME04_9BILA|nr:unnamed protein product [Didymodactylos carnosus]CAF4303873.1 unnamed protein product [Didymodactylos carnosus]
MCAVPQRSPKEKRQETPDVQTEESPLFKLRQMDTIDRYNHQYFNLIRCVIDTGIVKSDEHGTMVKSLFSSSNMHFNLRTSELPLLNFHCYDVWYCIKELLWVANGCRNPMIHQKKTMDAENSNNLQKISKKVGYTYWKKDDLEDLIRLIKADPNSHRLIICGWNVKDVPLTFVLPCDILCQFNVTNGTLSCLVYECSSNLYIEVPFKVALFSLLTYMIAHVCHLDVGEFIYSVGDIYFNEEQHDLLNDELRKKSRFPKLKIKKQIQRIVDFKFEDFLLDF